MPKRPALLRIENDRKLSPKTDMDFLYTLQLGLLLSLKEQGRLDEIQFHAAERKLRQQRNAYEEKLRRKGSGVF